MQKISTLLEKIFSTNKNDVKILLLSISFIFLVFTSYAILRPIRDALGVEQGELKWLFLATFIATLFTSFFSMWLSGVVKRRVYVNAIFIFFALNLLGFYVALFFVDTSAKGSAGFMWLARIFYVWVSVFNMFIITSAWSLIVDIYDKDRSKRLFGMIAAGASLGSICGALLVGMLAKHVNIKDFILFSLLLLALCLVIKALLIKESFRLLDSKKKEMLDTRFNSPIGTKSPLAGFTIILKSRFLLALCGFILLLTSVTTFLYMQQMHVLGELYPKGVEGAREARIAVLAQIDLVVNILSFVVQIFFTAKIAQFLGLKWLLSLLGLIICFGFIALIICDNVFGVALLPIAIVMSIRRVGEYALMKPAREMLFVPLDSDCKYKVKNFIDTVIYRGGDSIASQLESAFIKIGLGAAMLFGAFLSFLLSLVGLYLSKKYDKGDFK